MNSDLKRLPDEGFHAHITPSKRSAEDGVSSSSTNIKLIQSLDSGYDVRASKMLRIEQHDVNKQLTIHPKHQISSSPDESTINHLHTSSNGRESKELQGKKHVNASIRETKLEVRELSTDMKIDSVVMQSEREEKRSRSESDSKVTRDGHTVDISLVNWNELREHKSKRSNELVKESSENVGKDVRRCEDREVLKAREKTKEKERRQKDGNNNNHFKLGKSIHESKEHVKEDGISDTKVTENDKEQKDRERLQDTMDIAEGSISCKPFESENIPNKRENYPDVDKQERDNGYNEKDTEEKSLNAKEGDKDSLGHGILQKKRMSRSRGMPQSSNRQPREEEGIQGKDGVSMITYKVGKCIPELLKSWKEFEASRNGKIVQEFEKCPTLEIRIPPEHITKTNRQVKGAQLWGTDIYTNDSDLVSVLMHTGYCKQTTSLPSHIQELRVTIRVLPPQQCYNSTLRNSIHSRPWGSGIDCSFRIEKCCAVKKGGDGTICIEPQLALISFVEPTLVPLSLERTMNTRAAASNVSRQQRFVQEVAIQYNLCNEPWIKYSVNAVSDKGPKKPLYTSARLKRGEVLYLETHVYRYELCFGGEKTAENGRAGENACGGSSEEDQGNNGRDQGSAGDEIKDVFRWSRCKKPLPQKLMLSLGVPLPAEHVEVLEENLEWEDVQWSRTGVRVTGKEYPITRIHFLSPN